MGDKEKNKVLADSAHVPLAAQHEPAFPGVHQHSLHLDTARLLARGVVALCGMHQEPDALLDGFTSLIRVLLVGQTQSDLRVLLVGWVLDL